MASSCGRWCAKNAPASRFHIECWRDAVLGSSSSLQLTPLQLLELSKGSIILYPNLVNIMENYLIIHVRISFAFWIFSPWLKNIFSPFEFLALGWNLVPFLIPLLVSNREVFSSKRMIDVNVFILFDGQWMWWWMIVIYYFTWLKPNLSFRISINYSILPLFCLTFCKFW